MRNCWTATSYAEYHRNGCTHAAYSPGCRPLGSHSRLATTPSTMPRRLHRYKTLPARAPRGRYRYKTLPACPKHPFSAHFAPAGRTLYRFHHHQAEQGEFSTAYGTTYGTKLSRHAPPAGDTGTKLSQHARNTPFRRILRQQGELCTASTTTKPSRANFLPHTEPPTVQNSPGTRPRRAIPVQNSPGTQPSRPQPVQNSPSTRPRRPTRYKTLPACPKHPFSAHFAPAGRTLYRFHHHQAEQGEKSHARAAPRGAGQALTTPGTP